MLVAAATSLIERILKLLLHVNGVDRAIDELLNALHRGLAGGERRRAGIRVTRLGGGSVTRLCRGLARYQRERGKHDGDRPRNGHLHSIPSTNCSEEFTAGTRRAPRRRESLRRYAPVNGRMGAPG